MFQFRRWTIWILLPLFITPSLRTEGAEQQTSDLPLQPEPFSASGPFEVVTDTADWLDPVRERLVPIRMYRPADPGRRKCPVIVFSHGLGGSKEGCGYLGRMWASHGFLSVHPQHLGSDESVWKGKLRPLRALKASFEDPRSLQARVADLQFVLNHLEKQVADATPLGQKVDANRIGIAGHAFGALAALSLAGQRVPALAEEKNLPDPRVRAVLALSSPVILEDSNYREAYQEIQVPTLHVTGTNDDSPVGPTRAEHRRIPFDHMHGADRFLITFFGADHLSFSGHLRERAAKQDPLYQNKVAAASAAFWSAYLEDQEEKQSWLADGGMQTIVGEAGRVEYRTQGAPTEQGGLTEPSEIEANRALPKAKGAD